MSRDLIAPPPPSFGGGGAHSGHVGVGGLVRSDDAWHHGAGTALGHYAPQAAKPSPVKIIHRLLRGRVLLAAILAVAGGIAGAIYGYNSTTPKYSADGFLEIKPYVTTLEATEKTQGYFLNYVRSVPVRVANSRTVTAALNRTEWRSVSSRGPTPEFVGGFLNNLNVDYAPRDSFNLRVTYEDNDPRIAAAAVNAVLSAYVDLAREQVAQSRLDELKKQEDLFNKANSEFRRLQDTVINLSAEYGTDKLETLLEARQKAVQAAENALAEATMQLDLATSNQTAGGAKMPELTPEDVAVTDPMMRYFVENRAKALFNLVRLSRELGANHPNVARAQRDYEGADQLLNEYFDNNKSRFIDVRPDMDGRGQTIITPRFIEQLKQMVDARRKRYEGEQSMTKKLAERMTEIRKVRDEMDRAKEDLESRKSAKEKIEYQLASTGQVAITSEAATPANPSKDRRAQFAAAGALFGGGLPIGILMLIGLLDSRYRYSEETTETAMTGLTLLGILPNLPDRLSDPGQASIAAHCVHQVRTRLQIDAPVDGPVAYSVTSASSGDGKTSLTLALGLSFAASGSRTLLIDCDLVGAGLTARLGMGGPEGILDAITTRDLMRFVKHTDVSDLSMLPAGNAQLQHAGIFSPNAMKRLLNDARKHFDVILIDTGPILGSIEATPVCAAVDGVILTVARGQQRPLVEKALSHLRSIGSRISGVVFNRAQARDFEQSISGISLRSATRSQNGGHNAPFVPSSAASNGGRRETTPAGHYGSLAKAVATSVRGADPGPD